MKTKKKTQDIHNYIIIYTTYTHITMFNPSAYQPEFLHVHVCINIPSIYGSIIHVVFQVKLPTLLHFQPDPHCHFSIQSLLYTKLKCQACIARMPRICTLMGFLQVATIIHVSYFPEYKSQQQHYFHTHAVTYVPNVLYNNITGVKVQHVSTRGVQYDYGKQTCKSYTAAFKLKVIETAEVCGNKAAERECSSIYMYEAFVCSRCHPLLVDTQTHNLWAQIRLQQLAKLIITQHTTRGASLRLILWALNKASQFWKCDISQCDLYSSKYGTLYRCM